MAKDENFQNEMLLVIIVKMYKITADITLYYMSCGLLKLFTRCLQRMNIYEDNTQVNSKNTRWQGRITYSYVIPKYTRIRKKIFPDDVQ